MTMTTGAPLRILVPLDGSPLADQALAYAAAIAGPDDDIRLLYVAPSPQPPQSLRGLSIAMTEQDVARYEEQAEKVTSASAAVWGGILGDVIQETAYGDPATHILATVKKHEIDLIIMASHGRGAVGRWRFGSVTDRVVRSSCAPVLVVRPQDALESFGPANIFRIIVPLDGSERAAAALPVAGFLAKRLRKPVALLQVTPDGMLPLVAFGAIAAEIVAHDAALAAEHAAVQTLEKATADLEKMEVAVSWDVETGDPFERISEHAKNGDVIVLASHGRSGVTRWMLGSVAEKLIRMADAPVLVVRSTTG